MEALIKSCQIVVMTANIIVVIDDKLNRINNNIAQNLNKMYNQFDEGKGSKLAV